MKGTRTWTGAVIAACGLVLGSLGGQATATAAAAPAAPQWKLEIPLSDTASKEYWDVAATGASDAWAAGRKSDGEGRPAPALTHWDGAKWTDVAPAATGDTPAQLEKVAAAAPDDVWAAGTYVEPADAEPAGLPVVVQHWDGRKWSQVEHAAAPKGWVSFVGNIAAFGPRNLWLTDFQWNPRSDERTYALERWDGGRWQSVDLPAAPNGGEVQPWDITGTGPDDVWVTADAAEGTATTPVIYHWDGGSWTVREVPTPTEHASGWVANHAVATAPGTVYVLGKTNDPQRPTATMATRWDGEGWQPLPGDLPVDEVNAADVDGAGRLWISGWAGSDPQAVLSRWTGDSWSTEHLPADVTSKSEMSTVLGIGGVPGTQGVLAAGTAGCGNASDPVMCGVLTSRDLH